MDIEVSRAERDEGMSRVLDNAKEEWKQAVYNYIYQLPAGWTGTGEDIRLECPEAHTPHAWGAAINTAVRRKWLRHTGFYKQMKSTTSHLRETKVYERTHEQKKFSL